MLNSRRHDNSVSFMKYTQTVFHEITTSNRSLNSKHIISITVWKLLLLTYPGNTQQIFDPQM